MTRENVGNMKKETSDNLGKRFLLGTKDNKKYYLVAPSWDCGWYWGAGYVQTYNRSKRDIDMHTHFDSLFFNKNKNGYDAFLDFFDDVTLNKNEVWQLVEMMKTIYVLKETADVLGRGGSHYTSNPCKDIIINAEEVTGINKVVLPKLFEEVEELLTIEKEEKVEV